MKYEVYNVQLFALEIVYGDACMSPIYAQGILNKNGNNSNKCEAVNCC